MDPLVTFFHVFAAGEWCEPLREYLAALEAAGFDGPLYLGLVGDEDERETVKRAVKRDFTVIAVADEGNEPVTMTAMRRWASDNPDAVVLYAHTKGAGTPGPSQDSWRTAMLSWIVANWRDHAQDVSAHDPRERVCDIVGCGPYNPTEECWSPPSGWWDPTIYFEGGFWIAHASWVATAPNPSVGIWPDPRRAYLWPLRAPMRLRYPDGIVYEVPSVTSEERLRRTEEWLRSAKYGETLRKQ